MKPPALKSPLVDTHAHLDMDDYLPDLDMVLERAAEAGIDQIITVSTTAPSLQKNLEICSRRDNLFTTAGIHPHDTGHVNGATWAEIERGAAHASVVGIGETGLDFYRNYAPPERQEEAFLRHIDLARRVGKPLIIHSRQAGTRTIELLRREKAAEIGGVMHCFSGTAAEARQSLELGFLISLAGPLTYPRSKLPAVARDIPSDYLVLETDAPYLSPQSHRGGRNEPAFLVETARSLAKLHELCEEDVRRITTLNARTLFRLPGGRADGVIAYPIRDSLYLNVTNRCTNRCTFCGREERPVVKGHHLKLDREPTAAEIIRAAGDVSPFREVVICGFGEPLLRWDTVKQVAAALKKRGARIRINTNGQARLFLKKDVLPEMEGLVDALSVSLNAPTAAQYRELCRPVQEDAFAAVTAFIRAARRHVPTVIATAVTAPGIDIDACRRLAREELGVEFRSRKFNEIG